MKAPLVIVGIVGASAPAHADHRKFAGGVSLGLGVDVGVPEAGVGFAFRIGYRPVPRLAIVWTADLALVDLEPEGTTAAHALAAELALHEQVFLLAGPALGILHPPGGESTTGGGFLGAIGFRVQPWAQGPIEGDVEIELRAHAAFRDGESWSAALLLAGVGF